MQQSRSLSGGIPEEASREAALLDGLAARSSSGDKEAFEQIYLLLADELYGFVRAQCRDDHAAEDIVATVFLKAWRSARRYRSGSQHFRQWIFAIARNEVRDFWRTSPASLSIDDTDVLDEGQSFDHGHDRQADRATIARALRVLTAEQRQVVILRYFNNRSHEEIATIMGKREGAVRALLLRALRHMRKVMADATP